MSITEERLNKLAGDIIETLIPHDPPTSESQKRIFHRLVKVLILQAVSHSKGDTSEKMEIQPSPLEVADVQSGGQGSQQNVVRDPGTKNSK